MKCKECSKKLHVEKDGWTWGHQTRCKHWGSGVYPVTKPKPRRRAKPFRRWTWDRDNEAKLGPDRIDYDGKPFVLVEQVGLQQTQNTIALVAALNRARAVIPKK